MGGNHNRNDSIEQTNKITLGVIEISDRKSHDYPGNMTGQLNHRKQMIVPRVVAQPYPQGPMSTADRNLVGINSDAYNQSPQLLKLDSAAQINTDENSINDGDLNIMNNKKS